MKKSYFLFALVLLSSISMLRAQQIDNLIELKQKSQNSLFHRLDKAIETPAFERLDGGFRDCTCRIECTARTLPV